MLPSQYHAPNLYAADPSSESKYNTYALHRLTRSLAYNMDQNYIPPMRMSNPVTSGQFGWGQTPSSSSPALHQSRSVPEANFHRPSGVPGSSYPESSYSSYRRVSSPHGSSMPTPGYSASSGQTIPSVSGLAHTPMPSPILGASSGGAIMPNYPRDLSRFVNEVDSPEEPGLTSTRSPSMYDQNRYGTSAPSGASLCAPSHSFSYPRGYNGNNTGEAANKPQGSPSSMRILNQRPKPQCWEHGCNGRQFSTFSNLLRHQREKSGTAAKSYCPKCGAEFTRTTARNGHLAHDKCTKPRSDSGGSEP